MDLHVSASASCNHSTYDKGANAQLQHLQHPRVVGGGKQPTARAAPCGGPSCSARPSPFRPWPSCCTLADGAGRPSCTQKRGRRRSASNATTPQLPRHARRSCRTRSSACRRTARPRASARTTSTGTTTSCRWPCSRPSAQRTRAGRWARAASTRRRCVSWPSGTTAFRGGAPTTRSLGRARRTSGPTRSTPTSATPR